MVIQVVAALTAFVISFLIVPVVVKYSLKKNLVDIPGRRKIHKKVTPSLGGIAIFIGFFIAPFIWIDIADLMTIKFLLVALFIVFFIGWRDDLIPLRPRVKLIGQIVAACFLMFLFNLRVTGLYGLFGVTDIPLWVSYILTLFTVIIVTNSFNLIDGLDGLAGTISSISLLCFGVWFFLVGDTIYSILAFSMLGAIVGFLIFNWEPSEIFMGDTGALIIGFMLSVMAIHFINTNYALPIDAPYKFSASVTTAVCFIVIPIVDTSRIIILRLSKKQSPFTPDKSHIHHAIMRLGMKHGQSTIILGIVHLVYVGLAVLSYQIGDGWLLLGLIVLSIILCVFLDQLIFRKKAIKQM